MNWNHNKIIPGGPPIYLVDEPVDLDALPEGASRKAFATAISPPGGGFDWIEFNRHEHGTSITTSPGISAVFADGKFIGVTLSRAAHEAFAAA